MARDRMFYLQYKQAFNLGEIWKVEENNMKKSIKDFLTYFYKRGYNDFWLCQEPDGRWWFKANKENCESREALAKTRHGAIAKAAEEEKGNL